MATFRDKVVAVTLTYGATTINETEFDIPLILTGHNVTGNLVDIYTSEDDMLSAGFSENSPAYKMASLLFSGLMPPEQVIVGKREVSNFTLTPTAVNSTAYTITLKRGSASKTFSFTSDTTATQEEVAAGLVALINADTTWAAYITVTESNGVITLTPVSGTYVDVGYSDNITYSVTYVNSVTEDITNIGEKDNTWFYILSDNHATSDILALAAYAESNDKLYAFSSQDTAIRDKADGNVLATLVDTAYNHTWFTVWMSNADTTFPEASAVAQICSATTGTTTMHGKTLVGITLEKLTTTQESNIVSQNGNIYRKEHGTLFYRDGFVVSGLYVDFIIHSLWFKARLDESIFTLIKSRSMLGSGVRATTNGLELTRQAVMTNPIQVGISNGSISTEITTSEKTGLKVDLSPTVYIPSRADMTDTQINERLVDGMVVEYVYAGFFHYVKVQVNVLTNRTATNNSSNSTTVN